MITHEIELSSESEEERSELAAMEGTIESLDTNMAIEEVGMADVGSAEL